MPDCKFFMFKEYLCLLRTKHIMVTLVNYLMWSDKIHHCGGSSMDVGLGESWKEVYLENRRLKTTFSFTTLVYVWTLVDFKTQEEDDWSIK